MDWTSVLMGLSSGVIAGTVRFFRYGGKEVFSWAKFMPVVLTATLAGFVMSLLGLYHVDQSLATSFTTIEALIADFGVSGLIGTGVVEVWKLLKK